MVFVLSDRAKTEGVVVAAPETRDPKEVRNNTVSRNTEGLPIAEHRVFTFAKKENEPQFDLRIDSSKWKFKTPSCITNPLNDLNGRGRSPAPVNKGGLGGFSRPPDDLDIVQRG